MNSESASNPGTLFVVATPIGNRDDISMRALEVLRKVSYIIAEDTRHSQKLLHYFGIKNTLLSLHNYNEHEKSNHYVDYLLKGDSLALISDAGTPLISDPGFPLIKLARQKKIPVIPIPGPSALIAALSVSGLPCDRFLFAGFLSPKAKLRKSELRELKSKGFTLIIYESTHRLLDCIDDIAEIFGPDYEWFLAKEITKQYETFMTATSETIKSWLASDPDHCKGEFVLILPITAAKATVNEKTKDILSILLAEVPLKQAIKITQRLTNINKNELYDLALELKKV